MTLTRPILLAALVALPVLWILARRATARRDLNVSSLLLWRRLGLTAEPPTRTRRRTDLLLWIRLAAAAAAALAMAGPVIQSPRGAPKLHVLVDTSASMMAFSRGTTRALERIESHTKGTAEVAIHRRRGIVDLPAVLAVAGQGDVVVVTDHRPEGFPEGGRVRLVLVGEPVRNAGIMRAWVGADNRFTAIVTNFGGEERTVDLVSETTRIPLVIPPGGSSRATGEAPGGAVELRLEPGDRFAFDDFLSARRPVREPVSLNWVGPEEPRLRLVLEVVGVSMGSGRSLVSYRQAPDPATRLLVAPPGRRREIRGNLVTGPRLAAFAAPPPGLPLGRAAVLPPGGEVLLADEEGPLAVLRPDRVDVALDPGDPDSRWSKDPSFPVFFAEVARLLGVRESGGSFAADPLESGTRPESGRIQLAGVTPSPPPPPRNRDLTGLLLVIGAAFLLLHAVLEARSGMLSSAKTHPA